MLTREQPGAKPFEGEPHPLPEHLALPPGAAMRFQLSGPPLAAGGPVYARLTLPPAHDNLLATTVFAIILSNSDLEAASAGNRITIVQP